MSKLDELLHEVGLTRKDLRYTFTWKGRDYYIPTFNPLWWVISVGAIVGAAVMLYLLVVAFILIAPQS